MSKFAWMDQRKCAEIPRDRVGVIFFTPEMPEMARSFCALCPSRVPCAEYALRAEQGTSLRERFGVFGGLTPFQRHRIQESGGLRGADPIRLVNGFNTATKQKCVPIPDRRDTVQKPTNQLNQGESR